MNVYEYDGNGVVDQVATAAATTAGGIVVNSVGGVENICCRLRMSVTTDTTVTGGSPATCLDAAVTVLDSNRYDTCSSKDKQQQAAAVAAAAGATVPVVNIDSENYMLRGVGMDSPRSRSYSFNQQQQQVIFKENNKQQQQQIVDMDMFYLRETGSSLAGHGTDNNVSSMSVSSTMPDNSVIIGNCVSIPAGVTTSCARTMSFHALFCSCRMSCCCMCGSVCSPDCHSCFHSLCIRFAANYVCQRNSDVLQPITLNHDKVSSKKTPCNKFIKKFHSGYLSTHTTVLPGLFVTNTNRE